MAVLLDANAHTLARLSQFLDAESYTDSHEKVARRTGTNPVSIALSRQAGSRGAEIAREVGTRLNWPVYDHELLDRVAAEKGLSKRMLEDLDERAISWLEETVRAFCVPSGGGETTYIHGLLKTLASLSKIGHCVIVGRGAAQVLPSASTLSVRIVAPRPDRIAEVQKRTGLSSAEAVHWVDSHDRERQRFVQRHFHADAADPLLYDLVLNSKRLSTADCAALIVQAAQALEARQSG